MLSISLSDYLKINPSDEQVIELFKRVRVLQSNGLQIAEAIEKACLINTERIHISRKSLNADNAPAYLAIRHRAKLLKFRAEGFGYGSIAKMLAQRGAYNKETGKAYSRTTIQRACNLLERAQQ